MPKKKRVLLAGESWVSAATHYKGFDQFGSVTFHLGAEPLVKALEGSDFDLHYMPAHEAATAFPLDHRRAGRLRRGASSPIIGSNTLLLHPDVWLHGKPVPNRLKLLRDWVAARRRADDDRRLLSASRASTARARWHTHAGRGGAAGRPACPIDDRVEVPEGFAAELVEPEHPVLQGLGGDWPLLLGVNEVELKAQSQLLAKLPDEEGGHPLLVAGTHGKGRTLAWTSDIGPHWVPDAFVAWDGYARLWRQSLDWLTAIR